MIFKQILTPDKKNHTIEMPEQFYGKKVEVIVVEVDSFAAINKPVPPNGKKVTANQLLESFGTAP